MAQKLTYSEYLKLDQVLTAQHPRSSAHDELLFVIQHQTSELWMKLAITELNAARNAIVARNLNPAFKMLTRVARIFEQLTSAWEILRTMTPSKYTDFRENLGASSGFQSFQYRQIEFILGNRNPKMVAMHEVGPAADLQAELARPSLYDEVIALLFERIGDGLPALGALDRPRAASPEAQALWQRVYEEPDAHWDLYELAEKLMDLEDYFCLLYTSPSPRDQRGSRMPSSA